MQEFKDALSILKRDDECRVVLFTSTGTSFCEGLDLSMLLHTNKEERRVAAQELAHAVKYISFFSQRESDRCYYGLLELLLSFPGTLSKVWLLLTNLS